MRVLLIEDDDRKKSLVADHIRKATPGAEVTAAGSYHSGLLEIRTGIYDVLVLDMSLTTFDPGGEEDGGTPRPFAGRQLMRQMARHQIVMPVIVVTQYPRFGEGIDQVSLSELDASLREEHPEFYKGAVYYNESIEGWKEELTKLIRRATKNDR